jgi:hypothetical protein
MDREALAVLAQGQSLRQQKVVNRFYPVRGRMFIARRTKTPPAAFGGAELYSPAEALVAFRSSERRWFWHFNSGYKHLTPVG